MRNFSWRTALKFGLTHFDSKNLAKEWVLWAWYMQREGASVTKLFFHLWVTHNKKKRKFSEIFSTYEWMSNVVTEAHPGRNMNRKYIRFQKFATATQVVSLVFMTNLKVAWRTQFKSCLTIQKFLILWKASWIKVRQCVRPNLKAVRQCVS